MAGILDDFSPAGIITTGANVVGDAASKQQTDQTTVNTGPTYNQPGIQAVATQLPASSNDAQTATKNVAKIVAPIETKQGTTSQSAGNQATTSALDVQKQAQAAYAQSVKDTNDAALNVKKTYDTMKDMAALNPDAYMKNLGMSGQTITAIGIALSGIGSGLTGQPNMAMDVLQKNINRDITAQQVKFTRQAEILAQQRGILVTAQNRQMLAANAHSMATMSVLTGVQTAMTGMQAKVAGAKEIPSVPIINNLIQQGTVSSLNSIDATHVRTIQSQDVKKVNGLGLGYDAAAHVLGGQSIMDQDTANQRVQSDIPSPSQQSGLVNILQQESQQRNMQPEKKSFLIKRAEMGDQ